MSKPAKGLHEEDKRAEVFVSAASGDLRTVREIVKQGLLTMGCFPVEQANFPPDYRSVRQMIEARIAKCDAIIHIVGRRYGAEPDPATVPEGTPRRSYTQMEADIGRQLGKKLYVFLCPEDFPYDEEPDAETPEKQALQQAYRQQVAQDETLRTHIHTREELALKVRELQFELEKVKGAIARDRVRTFAVLGALTLVLAVLAAGVWWSVERAGSAYRFDRDRTREMLSAAIRESAQKQIAGLNPAGDWRKIKQIQDEEAQQLGDLDRFLDGIEQASQKGEASEGYKNAGKLLQEKGVGEAVAFLDSGSGERAARIEQEKNRQDRDQTELRKLLQEELLEASLLQKQFRFAEAEEKYRKIVADAGSWAGPRNAFSGFLVSRGADVDPARGGAMLREAVELCRSTLAMNPRTAVPRDWAETEIRLGDVLSVSSSFNAGAEGAALLQQSVAAYRAALGVFTKADSPDDWALAQRHLGWVLHELGFRTGGAQGDSLQEQAVAALGSALEIYTKADHPMEWGRVQINMGPPLADLGDRKSGEEGVALLQKGIAAERGALEVFTKAGQPRDWAMAQLDLGLVLDYLGKRFPGEQGVPLLREAAAAYGSALEVYTRADLPQDWAWTTGDLGDVFFHLGAHIRGSEGNAFLQKAIAADRGALEIYTKAIRPTDWARIQSNLGLALAFLGMRTSGGEGKSLLREGIEADNAALEVYTKTALPKDWARTQGNLNLALAALAKATEAQASPTPASPQ